MLLSLLSKRSLHADSRDSYGFNVRPQHLHRYREYANIYKEEEEERLNKWKSFLENQAESASTNNSNKENISKPVISQVIKQQSEVAKEDSSTEQGPEGIEQTAKNTEPIEDLSRKGDSSDQKHSVSDTHVESAQHAKSREVQTWAIISPSLDCIEDMMSIRAKRKIMKDERMRLTHSNLPSIDEAREESAVDEDVFYDNDDGTNVESCASDKLSEEPFFPWKQELEFLVHGGIPKDLRGEVWQAFVGVRTRRVEKYYQYLLATEIDASDGKEHDKLSGDGRTQQHNEKKFEVPEKWRKQIEKDLPRTFPGHPALNEKGRNSLRRVLLAYARHNPSVGYCQAMNFFAGLLLLMMPEENAFWTLVGIIDDYFEGYFSQEMIESQVDQLVLEDLMRERFPKLVNHLDYLEVQVAWLSGPWFLSIFLNMIPWESALRVWDVLLYEGNRVMLFRTALALMDLYGPAIVTTKDAGDAITLLQTLAGSTFDSSQLVLTACMGFLTVTEERLQVLREKHRPAIVAAVEERTKGAPISKDPKGLATKLYSFKRDRASIKENKTRTESSDSISVDEISDIESANMEEFVKGMTESEVDSLPELQDQVVWLKVELSRLMEDKRSAILRAEELESALMEMVKQDNRRELSARVEELEQEVAQLRQALADKKEGENAMLQVLMKVEQEQRVTEDARRFAEQEAAAQRYAVNVLEEKYEKAMTSLAQMEKRAIMAESMLQATLEYESGQSKALASPRLGPAGSQAEPRKSGLLSFGLGWRDRNKAKSGKEETGDSKSVPSEDDQTNGQKE